MKRTQYNYLKTWLTSLDRRPLIIRGARQVGKTWLVRHFSEQSGKRLNAALLRFALIQIDLVV